MRAAAALALFVVTALLASWRLHALDGSSLAPLVGHAYRGDATLTRSPKTTVRGGWTATARMHGDSAFLRVSPKLAAGLPAERFGAGDIIDGLFALDPPDEFARAVRAHAIARAVEIRATGRRRTGIAGEVDRLRRSAQGALAHGLPPSQAALLRGMVLGDDSALTPQLRDDFRRSGLSHLMAASGQNVALLVALAVVLASAVGVPFTARWAAIAVLIVLYVALAGGGPSIQRAGVMGLVGVLAMVTARPVAAAYALGLAAVTTLAFDPRSAADPGWQMSFAAVAGLIVFARPWAERLRRAGAPAGLAEGLAVTAAATLATAPIIAAHFGTASPVALPANLLAAPVVAPIMWLGLVAAAVGPVVPFAGAALDAAAGPLLGFLTAVAHGAAAAPGAGMHVNAVLVCLLSGSAFLVLGRGGQWRKVRRPALLAAVALTLPFAARALAGGHAIAAPPGLRMTFLDVGQGDATLVQDGSTAVLVDSGPPDAPIVAELRHAGIRRLAAVVVTHAQADHEGGAAAVLSAFEVGLVLDGRDGVRTPDGDRFATAAMRRHVRMVRPVAGAVVRAGPMAFEVLSPPRGPSSAQTGADPNQRAIVLELRDRGTTALLTADAESDVLGPLDLGRIDVLKVSHHGSADPGLPALLRRLRPRLAVIEVGAGNSYGHPAPSTLSALRHVPAVLRTDRDGTVRADFSRGAVYLHRR